MSARPGSVWVWRKLASAKWEAEWEERLRWVDPERLIWFQKPGARFLRIEIYCVDEAQGRRLEKQFGGKLEKVRRSLPKGSEVPDKPLVIAGRLRITRAAESPGTVTPGEIPLIIPAGMAFGTGDHATTGMCLRMLVETSRHQMGPWRMLDLGCGSGILAIAAEKLGATSALGIDFDPHAIRTAKENALVNQARKTRFRRDDVTLRAPEKGWHVIIANLFSEVLRPLATMIQESLTPGGTLIISGILKSQHEEVLASFRGAGLAPEVIRRKGKWVAMRFRQG